MNTTFRLKNHLLLAALAAVYPVLGHTAAAARVEFATGNVMAVSSAGPRPLTRGAELNTGETINTGDGRAQLRFADGAMMSLQPNTEFRIDDYNFSGKNDGSEKGFFSLLRGGLRTISGYIGKGNRDAYKVTTSVATIGIRGTEWSGVLLPAINPNDVELQLGTGEGAIEVCNGAGCIVVASGESAVVTGNTQPRRTDSRPNLPPSSTTSKPNPTPAYTEGDQRTTTGELAIVADNEVTGLASGSGYVAALATKSGSYGSAFVLENVDAVFNPSPGSNLIKVESGSSKYEIDGADIISAVDETGTIAWGTWSKGKETYSGSEGGIYDLDKVNFVIGKPTASSDLTGAALNGMTGTYKVIGSASSSTLGAAQLQSATLTAHFGTSTSVDLDMSVKAGTRTYTSSVDDMSVSNGTFSGYGSASWTGGGGSGSANNSVSGFFAGAKGSHAGVAYAITDNSDVTQGAIAFKQDTLKTTDARFTSGSGFAVAMVGLEDVGEGYYGTGVTSATSATFTDGSKLTEAIVPNSSGYPYGTYTYKEPGSVTQVGQLLMDGSDPVLGWGKWTGGKAVDTVYSSEYALTDVHYVVGKPTTDANFQTLSGSYAYNNVGGTTPTSQLGAATLNSASMNVSFGGSANPTTVALSVDVTAGGRNYTGTGSGSTYSSTFTGSGYVSRSGMGSNSLDFSGLFAGKNAKHAGVTYMITDGADGKMTRGAIGFSKGTGGSGS